MKVEEKILDAKEFTSMLLSCELSLEFNKQKPNKALTHTLKQVKQRVKSPRIKAVCDKGLRSFNKHGWLCGELNNISRIGKMSKEAFIQGAFDL